MKFLIFFFLGERGGFLISPLKFLKIVAKFLKIVAKFLKIVAKFAKNLRNSKIFFCEFCKRFNSFSSSYHFLLLKFIQDLLDDSDVSSIGGILSGHDSLYLLLFFPFFFAYLPSLSCPDLWFFLRDCLKYSYKLLWNS